MSSQPIFIVSLFEMNLPDFIGPKRRPGALTPGAATGESGDISRNVEVSGEPVTGAADEAASTSGKVQAPRGPVPRVGYVGDLARVAAGIFGPSAPRVASFSAPASPVVHPVTVAEEPAGWRQTPWNSHTRLDVALQALQSLGATMDVVQKIYGLGRKLNK